MKLMIAVLSSQKDRTLHDGIRSSWGQRAKGLGIETRFFLEPPPDDNNKAFERQQSDEVHAASAAGPGGLPYKVREVCKWASGKMIDNLFICYASTVVDPEKLALFLKENPGVDYAGRFNKPIGKVFPLHTVGPNEQPEHYERCYPWARGEFGYFLSRRAYREIAPEHPSSTIDDLWVGQVMGALAAVGEMTSLDIADKSEYHTSVALSEDIRALTTDEMDHDLKNWKSPDFHHVVDLPASADVAVVRDLAEADFQIADLVEADLPAPSKEVRLYLTV